MPALTRKGGRAHKRGGTRHHKSHNRRSHHRAHNGMRPKRAGTRHHRNHSRGHMGGTKYRKGSKSKTRPGHKNYVTHKGNKVFNKAGHYQRRHPGPYKGMRM